MDNLFGVIGPKMIYFFLLMLIGFGVGKLGIISREALPAFSGLIVKVLLPALQISVVFQRGATFAIFWEERRFVVLQLLVYVLLTVAGMLGSRLLRLKYPQRNSFRGGMIGGNVGFLLIPLIMAVFSEEGQSYLPVIVAVDTMYVWTVGLYFYTEGTQSMQGSRKTALLRRLLSPIFCAILIGLTLSSVHLTLPVQVKEVVDAAGTMSGTLGLMVLGVNIYYMDKHMKGNMGKVAVFIALRQIVVPLIVYILARHLTGPVEATLLMLVSAIPTMTTTGLLAIEYHTDVDFASNLVFLSTVSSMATIPMLALVTSLI